jgi:hypothetical protein
MNEIKTNKYYKELIDNKVNDVILLPIIFAGNEPFISPINKEKNEVAMQ